MKHAAPWSYHAKLSGSENHKGYSVRDGSGYWVADVSPRDEDGIEGKQFAALISSVPQLLEALEALVSIVRNEDGRIGYVNGSPMDKKIRAAEAAIKAAKGE